MKSVSVFLTFGLLGGLVTFLGGLVGRVEISVLVIRTIVAAIVSMLVLSALFFSVSKTLFPGTDLFASTAFAKKTGGWRKLGGSEKWGKRVHRAEQNTLSSDAGHAEPGYEDPKYEDPKPDEPKHEEPMGMPDDGLIPSSPDKSSSIRGKLRKADVKELARVVRHSINEEE